MYPLKKGKTTTQAHVGLPQGTYEEEHGRKGFYGKSAHLYHTHPPTGWVRFEGKLRPHCFDLNLLQPSDLNDPQGAPDAFLGNDDVVLYVSRRSAPMPFYFRNADGDELYFVHRGQGVIETDFGPVPFEKATISTSRAPSPTASYLNRGTIFSSSFSPKLNSSSPTKASSASTRSTTPP